MLAIIKSVHSVTRWRHCTEYGIDTFLLTSWHVRYWSMAHTDGMCVWNSCALVIGCRMACATISLVFPTALSPTTTHLTNSCLGSSLSMVTLLFLENQYMAYNKKTKEEDKKVVNILSCDGHLQYFQQKSHIFQNISTFFQNVHIIFNICT